MTDSKLAATFCSAVLAISLALVGFACEANKAAEERVVPRGQAVNLDSAQHLNDEIFTEARWTLRRPSGSASELSSLEGRYSSFVPDVTGLYVIDLQGRSGTAVTHRKLVFLADNAGPSLALLAPPTWITEASVLVTAQTSDVNNDPLTIRWSVFGPSGDEVYSSLGSQQSLSFIPEQPGTYTVVARASDGDLEAESQISVEVTPSSRTIAVLDKKPRFVRFSAKHRKLVYTDNVSPDSSKVVFLNVDTGEQDESIVFDDRAERMSMDPEEDTVVVQLENIPFSPIYALFDIATNSLVKRLGVLDDNELFMFNTGNGVFLRSNETSIERRDIHAETLDVISMQEPLLHQIYSPSIRAVYGQTSDGRTQWHDVQGGAGLLGTTTSPLPPGCFADMSALQGGDVLFVNGIDFYSTNQGSEVSPVGSLPSGVCSRLLHDERGLGMVATAAYDPQNTQINLPIPSFSVTDLENITLVDVHHPKVVVGSLWQRAAFYDVFLDADGLRYFALVVVNYDFEKPPFQQDDVSYRIVVGDL